MVYIEMSPKPHVVLSGAFSEVVGSRVCDAGTKGCDCEISLLMGSALPQSEWCCWSTKGKERSWGGPSLALLTSAHCECRTSVRSPLCTLLWSQPVMARNLKGQS